MTHKMLVFMMSPMFGFFEYIPDRADIETSFRGRISSSIAFAKGPPWVLMLT